MTSILTRGRALSFELRNALGDPGKISPHYVYETTAAHMLVIIFDRP